MAISSSLAPEHPLSTLRGTLRFSLSTAANGLSDQIDIRGHTLSSLQMSTAWTDASLTFRASMDATNFYDIYTSTGGEVTYTTTGSRMVVFDPIFWAGFRYLQVRSGTGATPVAQGAARSLVAVLQALGTF